MKPKRSNKTEQINIRVSPKEKIQLQKNASDMNMDMSDYIRKCTILSNSKNICGSLPPNRMPGSRYPKLYTGSLR